MNEYLGVFVCSKQFLDPMTEGEILALHFITLLHIVHVSLPPLCGSWRLVPQSEVDELHLICCQALSGDYFARETKQILRTSYEWDLLPRSVGPLRDSWLRWQRRNGTMPASVTFALHRLNSRCRICSASFSDKSEVSWDAQCQRALDDLHENQLGDIDDCLDHNLHPHLPFAILPPDDVEALLFHFGLSLVFKSTKKYDTVFRT